MTDLIYKVAGEDLSSSTQCYVSIDANGKVYKSVAGDGRQVIGVLTNAPKVSDLAEIAMTGDARVRVASTVKAGDRIGFGSNSSIYEGVTYVNLPELVDAGTGSGLGVALSSPGANGIIDVLVFIEADTGSLGVQTRMRFVSESGSDTSGDGSQVKPWATLTHALAQITDAASDNPYAVHIGPGTYADSDIATKQWVSIIGAGRDVTFLQAIGAVAGNLFIKDVHVSVINEFGSGGSLSRMENCASSGGIVITDGARISGYEGNIQVNSGSPEIRDASIPYLEIEGGAAPMFRNCKIDSMYSEGELKHAACTILGGLTGTVTDLNTYSPADASKWVSAPTSISAALDELAARIKALEP